MEYNMILYSITVSLSLLFLTKLLFAFFFSSKNKKNYPPSPPSLPIIGHLYLLKRPIHHPLAAVSSRYGPILLLRFGSRPVLVVSSPSLAEECFTKNDVLFANRVHLPSAKHLTYNYNTLGIANYGPHWRNMRRIATIEVLSAHRLNSFSEARAEETRLLVRSLFGESEKGITSVELKSRLFELSLNNLMRMIAGKRYYGEEGGVSEDAKRFRETVEEAFFFIGASNIGDFLPVLRWMDYGGVRKRVMRLSKSRDGFLQELIDEHRKEITTHEGKEDEQSSKNKTMIGMLLSLQKSNPEDYTDLVIKALITSLLSAGTDTSSGTIEWAMSLLLNNPEKLKKAQAEIDQRIEERRLIKESDLSSLPYLHCIITETLRLYPSAPLLIPHESTEECTVGGYDVPRGTMLLANVYSIHRDPKTWVDPTKFEPERFEDLGGEENKMMMPFGMGRRRCPGEGLAARVVGLVLGTMIQCFEWERVGRELVDMTDGSGVSMPKAIPLEARFRPRELMIDVLRGL